MRYYLSSYLFGRDYLLLPNIIAGNGKIGHINNARDFSGSDPARARKYQLQEMNFLSNLGLRTEALDLKKYFGKRDLLNEKLNDLAGVWVSGGNSFVLRQAMYLSHFDDLFLNLSLRQDFVYGGYSAGICVLCGDMTILHRRDDPYDMPYQLFQRPLVQGLGIFKAIYLPHYRSAHIEAPVVELEIAQCKRERRLFRTIKDGEVHIY